MNVLLGVTGGIAAYKSAALVSLLRKAGHSVNVVMTAAAAEFITPLTMETLSNNPVAVDMFADKKTWEVEHVALAKKADAAIIAPATASTIAKLACGLADNMLTTVFLALKCPVIVVPAMNTAMYDNTATQVNLQILIDRGIYVMQPGTGKLACGDNGRGRMREPDEIADFLHDVMAEGQTLKGKRVLISAGPTREPIDPVRYLTNRSSGKMGYALAGMAQKMGAEVTLVSGPVSLQPPTDVRLVRVESAEQMLDAVEGQKREADVVVMCAAVADYTPVEVADIKLKKQESLHIELKKTRDILEELGKNKKYYLVGFAAETNDVLCYARKKLEKKNLDMIVANDVSGSETGFDSDYNAVTLLKRDGQEIEIPKDTKQNIARQILGEIAKEL